MSYPSNIKDIQNKWVSVGIDLYLIENEQHQSIKLDKIVVPKDQRNEGVGTTILKEIISYADIRGMVILLTPSDDFGGSKSRLIKFYRRFGFVPNKGTKADYSYSEAMYRLPK